MTEDKERTVDKVMKLLAKAESTTEAEAEALIAKATDLMVRHEIDAAMLAHATGRLDDVIEEKSIAFKSCYSVALHELMSQVGSAYGFKQMQMVQGKVRRTGYWVGYRSDLEQAEMLLTSLMIQQSNAMWAWYETQDTEWMTSHERELHRRSHMLGFAKGVGDLLQRQRAATIDAVQTERATACPTSDSVALVLRSKDEQVKDWYDERYGHLRAGRSRRLRGSGSAASDGFSDGQRADTGSSALGARGELGR